MPILAALWAKISGWVVALGSILAVVAGAVLYGWRKGSAGAEAKVATAQAEQKVNTATAVANRVEVHAQIESEVAELPASPPPIAPSVPAPRPVPGSAADKLQQEFSRD